MNQRIATSSPWLAAVLAASGIPIMQLAATRTVHIRPIAEWPEFPVQRVCAKPRRNRVAVLDDAKRREIADWNAEVDRKRAEKKARKAAR